MQIDIATAVRKDKRWQEGGHLLGLLTELGESVKAHKVTLKIDRGRYIAVCSFGCMEYLWMLNGYTWVSVPNRNEDVFKERM